MRALELGVQELRRPTGLRAVAAAVPQVDGENAVRDLPGKFRNPVPGALPGRPALVLGLPGGPRLEVPGFLPGLARPVPGSAG
ncbi:MAG: hypothetical protein M0C28_43550 [Candidatus Moduliflexus flocculans]|nr:hypothetical protein [Candidatus Moduliflexus flocculans]